MDRRIVGRIVVGPRGFEGFRPVPGQFPKCRDSRGRNVGTTTPPPKVQRPLRTYHNVGLLVRRRTRTEPRWTVDPTPTPLPSTTSQPLLGLYRFTPSVAGLPGPLFSRPGQTRLPTPTDRCPDFQFFRCLHRSSSGTYDLLPCLRHVPFPLSLWWSGSRSSPRPQPIRTDDVGVRSHVSMRPVYRRRDTSAVFVGTVVRGWGKDWYH